MYKYPKRLIVEPTTRCNFKCPMCMKQSKGCDIPDGDLATGVLKAMEPMLARAESVVFTGIGEPLVYDGLEGCLAVARACMPENSARGFQTNGKLLTPERAVSLARAGMNRICISVDSTQPAQFDRLRAGGSLSDVEAAFDALAHADKQLPDAPIQKGVELVVTRQTLGRLPRVVEWAGQKGVDFMLVTHATAYHPETEADVVYMNNSHEALALFRQIRAKGMARGIDIRDYNKILWKFHKTASDVDIYNLVDQLKKTAREKDLFVNLFHLLAEDPIAYARTRTLFDQAMETAATWDIRLTLPAIRPRTDRHCPFIEKDAMFVDRNGRISPCYFLWHAYELMRSGYVKTVTPVYFGNVMEQDPAAVWNSPAYSEFRSKVKKYDYPDCHAWCETRCDYVLDAPFYQDCFINDIPCCDCHWSLGFLNCLH